MSSILVRPLGGFWSEPLQVGYEREADLQQILADHPGLIPGVGEDAVACKELQSGAGPADLIVVDQAGGLTLVECKLASNRQVRREIIGQMFDYASAFWRMPLADFEQRWLARSGISLSDSVASANPDFAGAVAANLKEGRFNIVLAVDAINDDLKRIVEYLNATSGPATSVIAVAYKRLLTEHTEILMPTTYGEELAEAKTAAAERTHGRWTEEECRSWMRDNDPENLSRFDLLLEEARNRSIPFVGSVKREKGVPAGSLQIVVDDDGTTGHVYVYHYTASSTSIELSFTAVPKAAGSDAYHHRMGAFLGHLEEIEEFHRAAAILRESEWKRRPNVPLSELSFDSLKRLVAVVANVRPE
ncbi:PDDEXK family nuclease [Arthrobacter sedimenti]|uniref:hypothetical protein n=1 Tax=Arthrobacter sedimenti TaxID=2694931 RepID=UPI000B359D63|nr:hypothetical protein [Arthrobacter sedimenti]OUM41085.1 hypothetical protein B8W73_12115 [Arthrobacter agilis]